MEWTHEKLNAVYERVVERAKVDGNFRKELLENPNQAIEKETGIVIPKDYKIRIIEQSLEYSATFLLPEMISGEIADEDLDAVIGAGACGANACGGNACVGNLK